MDLIAIRSRFDNIAKLEQQTKDEMSALFDLVIQPTAGRIATANDTVVIPPAAPKPVGPIIIQQGADSAPIPAGGKYRLGQKSLDRLALPVHPDLAKIVMRAIEVTEQDFTVFESLRTGARQKQLVATGMSKTMDSKHLIQSDGFCHAVDLVPWIDGVAKWDWDGCFKIACAMDRAATELGFAGKLIWGAVWDYPMSLYGSNSNQPDLAGIKGAVESYKQRHPGKDFLDGPHYQIS